MFTINYTQVVACQYFFDIIIITRVACWAQPSDAQAPGDCVSIYSRKKETTAMHPQDENKKGGSAELF